MTKLFLPHMCIVLQMKSIPIQDLMHKIRLCQAGDEESFAWLFHHYKNMVYKTASILLASANDAEDVLQEVFLNGIRLTWDLGEVRLEILSNLPFKQVLRIAASIKPVEIEPAEVITEVP